MKPHWKDCPMQFVERIECPICGSVASPILIRSQTESDGSVSRRCICRSCSGRFLRILEPQETEILPVFGSDEN